MKNGTGTSRMVVTTPKNYGNAVERNRTKRIIREVFRNIKEQLKTDGYDLLFIVYKKELEYKDTFSELFSICGQAGILNVSE
jgi:ribonuclease P protein component